ncbi:MAG: ATP-binding protein [Solirubrobacterales bacterium]
MNTPLWLSILGSLLVACAVARWLSSRRRRRLAREMHELRGSLTAARLVVDMMPWLGESEPAACLAASDELARSYRSLCAFDRQLHAPPWGDLGLMRGLKARARTNGLVAVAPELDRLTLIWQLAADRLGRQLVRDLEIGDARVRGSRRHLTEAVTNLLSNAVRHGDGTITLSAKLRPEASTLRIEVRDEGPGLTRPVASLASARRNRVGLRRLGPHGHGLSVAVRAAQRLGGAVSSAPSNGGAVLVLELPLAAVDVQFDEFEGQIDAPDYIASGQARPVGLADEPQ